MLNSIYYSLLYHIYVSSAISKEETDLLEGKGVGLGGITGVGTDDLINRISVSLNGSLIIENVHSSDAGR